MYKIEKTLIVAALLFQAMAGIILIGKDYHVLLAVFELLLGVNIGMTIFFKKNK